MLFVLKSSVKRYHELYQNSQYHFYIFFSFTYGLGVGLYKWFPYENLRNIKNTYIDREPELLTIEDLKLSTSTERSGYWSVVNNSQNEINDPIILNMSG